jgi:hypothetical protein
MENGPYPWLNLALPIFHSPLSILQQLEYFPRPRVPIQLRLLEDRRAVTVHLEASATRRQQSDFGLGIRGTNLGRQTDGPGFVVSERAVLDADLHAVRVEGVV